MSQGYLDLQGSKDLCMPQLQGMYGCAYHNSPAAGTIAPSKTARNEFLVEYRWLL